MKTHFRNSFSQLHETRFALNQLCSHTFSTFEPKTQNHPMSRYLLYALICIMSSSLSNHQVHAFASAETPKPVVASEVTDQPNSELLQLPPSDPNNSNVQTLQFGQAMKLDHLGPIIINTDGTTRRIDNWDTLSEREKETTWRRIKKRNAERREMLEAKLKEEELKEQTTDKN
jgi:hypothetical protein